VRIFITGQSGQLGTVLQSSLRDHTLGGASLPKWDMTDLAQVRTAFGDFHPDVVIHTAALTNVDFCADNREEAVRINSVGSYNVALVCRELNARMVAISTNEVFDGKSTRPYQEYDQRNPINPYGYSKCVAEQVIERYAPHYQIVRTAWLYGPVGANFIHKILTRAEAGEPLQVVMDEVGSPTNVFDLADALAKLVLTERPGIYHLVNSGECSRYEFAKAILEAAGFGDVEIEPISIKEFSRPSMPPAYTPLDNIFAAAAGIEMRSWRDALVDFGQTHLQRAQP